MMKFNRNICTLTALSLFLFACNETAASKIQTDNQSSSQAQPSYAEITFDNIFHDFGNIKEGEIAKTIFKFTNTGDAPLIISNVKSTCGCTVPECKQPPLAPGEEGEITVGFNSQYLLDGIDAISGDEITIESTDPVKPAVLRGVGDKNYLYLVMPQRLTT